MSALRRDIQGLEYLLDNCPMERAEVVASLRAITAADRERQRPRIKVSPSSRFIVDDGLASDTFTLGPPELFRGRIVREVVAEAAESGGVAKRHHEHYAAGDLLRMLAKAEADEGYSPVSVVTVDTVHGRTEVTGEDGEAHHFNTAYWDAARSIADSVEVKRHAPAIFRSAGIIVALVMPYRVWGDDL